MPRPFIWLPRRPTPPLVTVPSLSTPLLPSPHSFQSYVLSSPRLPLFFFFLLLYYLCFHPPAYFLFLLLLFAAVFQSPVSCFFHFCVVTVLSVFSLSFSFLYSFIPSTSTIFNPASPPLSSIPLLRPSVLPLLSLPPPSLAPLSYLYHHHLHQLHLPLRLCFIYRLSPQPRSLPFLQSLTPVPPPRSPKSPALRPLSPYLFTLHL